MSIQVDLDQELLQIINKESSAEGCSQAEYVDRVISELFRIPVIFEDSRLKEVIVYSRLFGDRAMKYLPTVAEAQRRHPDQQMLWLLDQSRTDSSEACYRSRLS